MDPKDLIAALGVLADPNASEEAKAAALDKLTAYFNSQLDSQESQAASEVAEEEKTSESGDEKKDDEEKKEMASALADARDQIKALTARMAKLEKASTVGNAVRAKAPTIIQRVEASAAAPAADPHAAVAISMIERAAQTTINTFGKK